MDLPLVSTVVGAGIILLVIADMVITTVAVSGGAGPITRTVTKPLWKGVLFAHRRLRRHRLLRAVGPLMLFAIMALWLLGLILGWSLVFGQEGSLIEQRLDGPVPALGRFYYAASIILGRGGSDVVASEAWRVTEQVAAASGIALISLSLAYVLAIVGAVVRKREVAGYVSSLGGSPDDILGRAWNGEDFGELGLHFIAMTPMVSRLAQDHLAYPILHYFHSGERYTAIGPSIVVLDETLTILEDAVEPDHRIDHPSVWPLRTAIDAFLRTLVRVNVERAPEPLPRPMLEGYRTRREIPLLSDDEVHEALDEQEDRRLLLAGLLYHDGWTEQETHAFDHEEFQREAEEQDERELQDDHAAQD